jgi:hypothetical protein
MCQNFQPGIKLARTHMHSFPSLSPLCSAWLSLVNDVKELIYIFSHVISIVMYSSDHKYHNMQIQFSILYLMILFFFVISIFLNLFSYYIQLY